MVKKTGFFTIFGMTKLILFKKFLLFFQALSSIVENILTLL